MKSTTLYRSIILAGGLTMASSVFAGIADTKHNLGSGAAASNNQVSDTAEICVFCHTPHAADTTAVAPLWNKDLGAGTGYQTYSSTTMDAEIAGGVNTVGSVSLACLSCHDGSQAMDNIINAPGSGGYDSTGGGENGLAWSWTGTSVDANGKMTSATVAMLGTDLRNDHPIGIQYGGGGLDAGSPSGATNDPDFNAPANDTVNSTTFWWVDTEGTANNTRNKTDMILYTRTDFSGGVQQPSVECASCHDPHSTNNTFLRISNDNSAVCLACHDK